jgi:hypothetical protein
VPGRRKGKQCGTREFGRAGKNQTGH